MNLPTTRFLILSDQCAFDSSTSLSVPSSKYCGTRNAKNNDVVLCCSYSKKDPENAVGTYISQIPSGTFRLFAGSNSIIGASVRLNTSFNVKITSQECRLLPNSCNLLLPIPSISVKNASSITLEGAYFSKISNNLRGMHLQQLSIILDGCPLSLNSIIRYEWNGEVCESRVTRVYPNTVDYVRATSSTRFSSEEDVQAVLSRGGKAFALSSPSKPQGVVGSPLSPSPVKNTSSSSTHSPWKSGFSAVYSPSVAFSSPPKPSVGSSPSVDSFLSTRSEVLLSVDEVVGALGAATAPPGLEAPLLVILPRLLPPLLPQFQCLQRGPRRSSVALLADNSTPSTSRLTNDGDDVSSSMHVPMAESNVAPLGVDEALRRLRAPRGVLLHSAAAAGAASGLSVASGIDAEVRALLNSLALALGLIHTPLVSSLNLRISSPETAGGRDSHSFSLSSLLNGPALASEFRSLVKAEFSTNSHVELLDSGVLQGPGSVAALRAAVARARAACATGAHAIVVLPDLELLCPRRASDNAAARDQLRAQNASVALLALLLTEMDGVQDAATETSREEGPRGVVRTIGNRSFRFLQQLEEAPSRQEGHLLFVGLCADVNALDPALRRPGRFDLECMLSPPSADARARLLEAALDPTIRRANPSSDRIDGNGDVRKASTRLVRAFCALFAAQTGGFSAGDLWAALSRCVPAASASSELGQHDVAGDTHSVRSFLARLGSLLQSDLVLHPPSALRGAGAVLALEERPFDVSDLEDSDEGQQEEAVETPGAWASPFMHMLQPEGFKNAFVEPATPTRISKAGLGNDPWACIGGQAVAVERIRSAVEAPLRDPETFRKMNLRPPKGLLLYGPPGNSKTILVKALSQSLGLPFFALQCADLASAYVGESEERLRSAFRRARACAPAVLFFDEIDSLAGSRERNDGGGDGANTEVGVLTTFLTEMDGISGGEDGVLVVGATNRPYALDPALVRAGRLEIHVEVPSPDAEGRFEILKVHTCFLVHESVNLRELAHRSELNGWSGAMLENLCREAAIEALRDSIDATLVSADHFERALKSIRT